jgi:cytochrome c oxidase subunit IV
MASRSTHAEHERMERAGVGRYVAVWAALLAFTVLTFYQSRLSLPHPWHLVVALVIASTKSALVIFFFMHLWDHGGANRLVVLTSLVFVALLMGITLMDNATRFPLTNPPTRATERMMPPGPDPMPGQAEPGPSQHSGR